MNKKQIFFIILAILTIGLLLGLRWQISTPLFSSQEHNHEHGEGEEHEICKEHNVLEAECGICQVHKVPDLGTGKGMKIRMGSLYSAIKAGVETVKPVLRAPLTGIQMPGKITYNYHRLAHITALAPGVTGRVLVQNGDRVKKGQLLMEILSNDMVTAKEDYLNALSLEEVKKLDYQREKKLRQKEISAARDYELALARYNEAKQRTRSSHQKLVNLGFSKQHFRDLEKSRAPSPVLPVPAPFDGTIVFRHAVRGEATETGEKLLTLADLSQFWLELSIPEQYLPQVRLDALVKVLPEALPAVNIESRLTWISSGIDENTRTLKGRAILENSEGLLKHGMYARVFLQPRETEPVLTVPAKSVHLFSERSFLFVKLAADLYEVRRVKAGSKQTGNVEILQGLKGNEIIVADHSFIIKSELLKSRLGAGCVDE
jgi:membrane fusion protein, heavy metal efflux system